MGLLQSQMVLMVLLPAAGKISVDVLQDLQHMNKQICYNFFAVLLQICYGLSDEVSGEIRLFLLFHERTVFCYHVAKASYFLLPGSVSLLHSAKAYLTVRDGRSDGWRPGGWEIKSPGGRPALPLVLVGCFFVFV